jgi:hypothetical protein
MQHFLYVCAFHIYCGTCHLHWCVPFVKNGLIILRCYTSYRLNSPLLGVDLFSQLVISIITERCTVNRTRHSTLLQWSDFSYCHVWNVLVVSCLMDGYRCRVRTYVFLHLVDLCFLWQSGLSQIPIEHVIESFGSVTVFSEINVITKWLPNNQQT